MSAHLNVEAAIAVNPQTKPIPLCQSYDRYVHDIPSSKTQDHYLKEIPSAVPEPRKTLSTNKGKVVDVMLKLIP